MPLKDDLGKRMKEFYEGVPKTRLIRRVPVAIRLDGRNFHGFTRGFKKPFDDVLIKTMQETMKYLCENVQGCVLGYTQSDEITLILVDYKKLTTSAWLDYEVQKLCSIVASMCTMAFNRFFSDNVQDYGYDCCITSLGDEVDAGKETDYERYTNVYMKKLYRAMFDARCFNIPKEEVCNLLYWRQLDATRNSIQMLGQSEFSHNELWNKSCNDIQDMLMTQKGINWNDLETTKKRGSCCIKNGKVVDSDGVVETVDLKDIKKKHTDWVIDNDIPIFSKNRAYIEDLVCFESE